MMRRRIELQIDELVLRGFAPGDRHRIGEAVEQELARLLSQRAVSPAMINAGERGRVDGGSFAARLGASPETIGAQVAQAVFGGIQSRQRR